MADIELIIKINEEDYATIMSDKAHQPRSLTNLEWKIANGIPLDKIRVEIKEESRFCPLTEGLERALEIIDKYTAEKDNQDTVPFDFELYRAGLMDMPKGMIEVLDKIKEEIKDNTYFINETTEKEGIDFETVEKIINKYITENTSNCDSCKYQKEVDGSNCYECVKGIRNNYTAEKEWLPQYEGKWVAESDIEKRKECPHKPCINHEDGCEEWAGCPCVYYKAESEG